MDNDESIFLYIVFPVFNRLEATKRFLNTLKKQTVSNYKLILCDDGSTDGTGEYLRESHPDVVILEGEGDLWWTAGINKCVNYVLSHCNDSDYILTINNDVTLPGNYLEQKLLRAKEYPRSIIGSLCVYSDDEEIIETSGYVMDFQKCENRRLTRPSEKRTEKHRGVWEATHLPGKGVLIPVAVFNSIGLYDEINLPQYHADTDYVLRAHSAGFKVLVDFDSLVLSEVNINNMVLPKTEITLSGIAKTFIGPYSMNNFTIYNRFAMKHFPDNRWKYLFKLYAKIVSGLVKRYVKWKFVRLKSMLSKSSSN